jgi:hypothetical protein
LSGSNPGNDKAATIDYIRLIERYINDRPWVSSSRTAKPKRLAEHLAYFRSLPKINENLTDEEIIGYDENGVPI